MNIAKSKKKENRLRAIQFAILSFSYTDSGFCVNLCKSTHNITIQITAMYIIDSMHEKAKCTIFNVSHANTTFR